MASRETMSRRWAAALIGLAVIALAAVGVALYLRGRAAVDDLNAQIALLQQADDSSETLYEWAGDDARAEAAALRGLALPANADSLQLAREGRLRPTYWLRFQLPADALAAFLASTCVEDLDADYRPAFVYGADPDMIANLPWWQPDAAQSVAGGDCADDTGVHYRILADLSAGTTATLYMEISTEPR